MMAQDWISYRASGTDARAVEQYKSERARAHEQAAADADNPRARVAAVCARL